MLGTNLHISKAKYSAPDKIDYIEIMDGDTKIKLIDENSASGAVIEDNKEVDITSNGSITINPTAGKDAMKKVTATVSVPTAELEDNKTATINASTYVSPVEITPTAGKDGMKKATVTLSNLPNIQALKEVTVDALADTDYTFSPSAGYTAMAEATVTFANTFNPTIVLPCFVGTDTEADEERTFIALEVDAVTGYKFTSNIQRLGVAALLYCLETGVVYRKNAVTTFPTDASTTTTITYADDCSWSYDNMTLSITSSTIDLTISPIEEDEVTLGTLIVPR